MKNKSIKLFVTIGLLIAAFSATSKEIGGVTIPDQVNSSSANERLVLNGVGLRKKFFMKIYAGALYLPSKTESATEAMNGAGHKQVLMHIIYDEVPANKMSGGLWDGVKANHMGKELAQLEKRGEAFRKLIKDSKAGDRIWFDLISGEGVRVFQNGEELGRVQGDDFSLALLKMWLGDNPVSGDLKSGMLGEE